jgi:hypothetical protein
MVWRSITGSFDRCGSLWIAILKYWLLLAVHIGRIRTPSTKPMVSRRVRDRKLFNAAIEVANNLDSVFAPGKWYDISNHEELELASVKLYRAAEYRRSWDGWEGDRAAVERLCGCGVIVGGPHPRGEDHARLRVQNSAMAQMIQSSPIGMVASSHRSA